DGSNCTVNTINLIRNSRVNIATGRIPSAAPCPADAKSPARVLPRRTLVGLYCAISPTPLTLCSKGHIGLNLDPVSAPSKHSRRRQVRREGGPRLRDWDIRRAVNLRPRKTRVVGIDEHVPIVGRSRPIEIHPIGI